MNRSESLGTFKPLRAQSLGKAVSSSAENLVVVEMGMRLMIVEIETAMELAVMLLGVGERAEVLIMVEVMGKYWQQSKGGNTVGKEVGPNGR